MDNPTETTCGRCNERLTLARSGNYVTGHGGWILPSHLNTTCDGIHLHEPIVAPRPDETYWDYVNRVAERDATVVNTQYLVTRPTAEQEA